MSCTLDAACRHTYIHTSSTSPEHVRSPHLSGLSGRLTLSITFRADTDRAEKSDITSHVYDNRELVKIPSVTGRQDGYSNGRARQPHAGSRGSSAATMDVSSKRL